MNAFWYCFGITEGKTRARWQLAASDGPILFSSVVLMAVITTLVAPIMRNSIDLYYGAAHFESPPTLVVEGAPTTPRTMTVVGAGIIGCEYGAIFATLGTEVTLVDRRSILLEFVDREIVETLTYHMRRENMTLRLGEAVAKVFIDEQDRIVTELESGKRIITETLLFTIGREEANVSWYGFCLFLFPAGISSERRRYVTAHQRAPNVCHSRQRRRLGHDTHRVFR